MSAGSSGPKQAKATRRPSSLIAGSKQFWRAGAPAAPVARLASVTAPVSRSLT